MSHQLHCGRGAWCCKSDGYVTHVMPEFDRINTNEIYCGKVLKFVWLKFGHGSIVGSVRTLDSKPREFPILIPGPFIRQIVNQIVPALERIWMPGGKLYVTALRELACATPVQFPATIPSLGFGNLHPVSVDTIDQSVSSDELMRFRHNVEASHLRNEIQLAQTG